MKMTCRECNGVGTVDYSLYVGKSDVQKCLACNGTGEVEVPTIACRRCEGTGVEIGWDEDALASSPCPDCQGTGKRLYMKQLDCMIHVFMDEDGSYVAAGFDQIGHNEHSPALAVMDCLNHWLTTSDDNNT